MKKIPTLFVRDMAGNPRQVLRVVTPGCEWVLIGDGAATRKWDGTAVMVRDGAVYRRCQRRAGDVDPPGFILCTDMGKKRYGWQPATEDDDLGRKVLDAYRNRTANATVGNGTYEAIGPKIQGNPDGVPERTLVRHGKAVLPVICRTFDGLRIFLEQYPIIEGIVFHHPDGRMAKLKQRDFGFPWPPKEPKP